MGEHETKRRYSLRRRKDPSKEVTRARGSKVEKDLDLGRTALIGKWLEKLKDLGLNSEENTILEKKSTRDGEEVFGASNKEDSCIEEWKTTSNEERKEKIRQFGGISHLEFKGLSLNFHLYLPKTLQKLSRIFRVLETIQRFNTARNLTTIFIKSLGCIENLVKQRVQVEDIERMYYIAPRLFGFKRINIHHDGKEVRTFVIYINGEAREFNEELERYVKDCHLKFLKERGYDYNGNGFHPEFDFEEIPLYRKPLFPEEAQEEEASGNENLIPVKRNLKIEEVARKRASTILERIREKERMRREEFMNKSKEEEDNVLLSNRIQILFKSENKRAIPVSRVVELLKIFDGANTINRIIKWDSSLFYIKTMNGTEYLVSKG
ncbi:uncharacterized protein Eint_061360 [Encephalitozoon intestinalis ATCC 50506]|uniref:CDT1 Geminin-binding domain-containing protein n=1 Tax=Encephalitozoon intestinalis (strain ATCC 50506) TaxID=876142 RepID=E0S7R2_ENCIT|nr:uncharacterized protein Eint_061360 [Encephalitozoon intestinalis ATCC 50506]ADM11741.1 hypothetical protein Eint_061360 [Encephalitozoon intestinalis ATCC 50506]UTX45480.1 hypothetical protein GPK93_06g10370 [Encephalitozoon intestinalis]